jgi:hypothetical protein
MKIERMYGAMKNAPRNKRGISKNECEKKAVVVNHILGNAEPITSIEQCYRPENKGDLRNEAIDRLAHAAHLYAGGSPDRVKRIVRFILNNPQLWESLI